MANYVSQVNAALSMRVGAPAQSLLATKLLVRLGQLPKEPRFMEAAPAVLVANLLGDASVDLAVRFGVALLWFLSLRVRDVVSDSVSSPNLDFTLLWSDVSLQDDGVLRLTLRRSKSDPTNAGSNHYLLPETGQLCPVRLFREYRGVARQRRWPLQSPLLRRVCNDRYVTRSHIATALKHHATLLGLDDKRYSTHSCRIGSATVMIAKGLSMADVMLQGRWQSEKSAGKYLRLNSERATRMQSALSLEGAASTEAAVQPFPNTTSGVLSLRPSHRLHQAEPSFV